MYTMTMTHPLAGKKQSPEHIEKRVASCKKTGRKLNNRIGLLLSKIAIDENDCWVWQGSRFKKPTGDYGQIRLGRKGDNKLYLAHRVSYREFIGEIPDGLELDHLCHNKLCINPDHLEAVTHLVNMQRAKDIGKPYCNHGHEWTPETTYINVRGRRECRTCMRNRRLKLGIS